MKSLKMLIAVVVIVLELAACLYLLQAHRKDKDEIQRTQSIFTELTSKFEDLSKTTVPSDDHNRVVSENNRLISRIRAMKDAAIVAGRLSATEPMATPEQICQSIEQTFRKPLAPEAPKIGPAEVEMLIAAVSSEISQKGVIDTKQTEKYGVGIYLIQKVMDAVGYPISAAGGIKDTCEAVMKFQGDRQLKQDGKVGQGTWGKVREFWATKKTPGQALLGQPSPVAGTAAVKQPLPPKTQPATNQNVIKLPQPAQTPAGPTSQSPMRRYR
jgi:hypothetical protein